MSKDEGYLDVAICKQVLDKGSVRPGHASMVDGEAEGQQVAQVCVLAGLRLCLQDLPAGLALLSHVPASSQQQLSKNVFKPFGLCKHLPIHVRSHISAKQVLISRQSIL